MRHNALENRNVLRESRRLAALASGLVAAALILAGCSSKTAGPTVATVPSSAPPTANSQAPSGSAATSASPTPGGTTATASKGGPLAFSECMRAHGIGDFPDPNADGEIQISGGPGSDLGPDNPANKAATEACKSLSPQNQLSPAQAADMKASLLKYAQCMRAHGISDFPDPAADGGLRISSSAGSDLDQNNPQNQAATKACAHDQPKPPGGGGGAATLGGS